MKLSNLLPKKTPNSRYFANDTADYASIWTAIALFLILVGLLCSCSPKTIHDQVYIDHYHTDTLRITNQRVDSIYQRDSIAVLQKGDTILITKYRDRYRYRNLTDTLYSTKIEYKTQTQIQKVEVKRALYWWQKTLMLLGVLWIIGIGICVWWIVRSRR